jgi:hypothetical protein
MLKVKKKTSLLYVCMREGYVCDCQWWICRHIYKHIKYAKQSVAVFIVCISKDSFWLFIVCISRDSFWLYKWRRRWHLIEYFLRETYSHDESRSGGVMRNTWYTEGKRVSEYLIMKCWYLYKYTVTCIYLYIATTSGHNMKVQGVLYTYETVSDHWDGLGWRGSIYKAWYH